MRHDDLEARMRVYETAHEQRALPGLFLVARLDGRSFTQLTKETLDLERLCRISQLPTEELVLDYFRWRQQDAHRNAISGHCYWRLRDSGLSARRATAELEGRSVSQKNELLFQHGINVAELPAWQKCGTGLWWHQIEKVGQNPRTGEEVTTTRRRLRANSELPYGEAYAILVREILTTSAPTNPARR